MCVGVCVRTRAPSLDSPFTTPAGSTGGFQARPANVIEVNEGGGVGGVGSGGLSRCIQMPVLNCSNRAGYLVWASGLNSTPVPADYCIQPAVFVFVVAAQGAENIPVTSGLKLVSVKDFMRNGSC